MRIIAQYEWLIMLLGPFLVVLYFTVRDERRHRAAKRAESGTAASHAPKTPAR